MAGPRLRMLVASSVLALGVGIPAGVARADPASDFVSSTNALRAAEGIAPLTVDSRMVAIAQQWSEHMASTQTVSHNPNLGNEVPADWEKYGENVGTGPSVDAIEKAFVNSPHHYANLVDPEFRLLGVAVVIDARGALWVTEDFLLEAPASSPPPPPPASSPITSPAPSQTTAVASQTTAASPPPTTPAPATSPPPPTTPATGTTTTTAPAPSASEVAAKLSALDARS